HGHAPPARDCIMRALRATDGGPPMTTRRDFLQTTATLAGLVFVGCDLLAAAPARAQARRREVVINGKRVKTVDVHADCAVPEAPAELQARFKGNGYLGNVIGNPLETTIALSHLIFEGTLDKFPGLKICAAHAGGFLPSYSGRSDFGCPTRPDLCPGGTHGPIKKKPSEYMKQLYYDTMVFNVEGVRHLAAEVGVSQLVVGTDFPYPWTKTAVDLVLTTP